MKTETQTVELTIDELIAQTTAALPDDRPPTVMEQVRYARGYTAIWNAWTKDDIAEAKQLANKQLGFATDGRDYTDAQYRDILTTATLRGARLIDNEFCVFSDKKGQPKVFFQKGYWIRRLRELPGFSDFSWTMGEVVASGGGKSARVAASAEWRTNGRKCSIDCTRTDKHDGRLTVKMYEKDGPDLLIGKAEARLFAKVYHQCTGSQWAAQEADADAAALEDAIAETEQQPAEDNWRRHTPAKWKNRLRSAETLEQVEDVRRDWGEECETDEDRFLRDQACDGRKGELS